MQLEVGKSQNGVWLQRENLLLAEDDELRGSLETVRQELTLSKRIPVAVKDGGGELHRQREASLVDGDSRTESIFAGRLMRKETNPLQEVVNFQSKIRILEEDKLFKIAEDTQSQIQELWAVADEAYQGLKVLFGHRSCNSATKAKAKDTEAKLKSALQDKNKLEVLHKLLSSAGSALQTKTEEVERPTYEQHDTTYKFMRDSWRVYPMSVFAIGCKSFPCFTMSRPT
ncbi:hypothetical protein R1flu_021697 [Riccia fluitans]|uniref:Uncharacterized protein n=1 Tax=Riccia fluitans TaxID=41844 RepID=A0ABD1ZTA6_9MARC